MSSQLPAITNGVSQAKTQFYNAANPVLAPVASVLPPIIKQGISSYNLAQDQKNWDSSMSPAEKWQRINQYPDLTTEQKLAALYPAKQNPPPSALQQAGQVVGKVFNAAPDAVQSLNQQNAQISPPTPYNIGQAVTSSAQATGNFMKNTVGNPYILANAALLGGTMAAAGGAEVANTAAKASPTIEQIIEKTNGWQPGLRKVFDTALMHNDAATIKNLLPQIPPDYVSRFAPIIQSVLKGVTQ
jgi:hypothetical protein